jgi:thiamine-monophosphate kinase
MTEQEIINIVCKGIVKAPQKYGVGDDAAATATDVAVTHDTMIEGVHFDDKLTAEDIGWKIVAVNVSDIAAMGARPDWATLSLSVPSKISEKWVREMSTGLHKALKHWNIRLIGGDTTRSPGPIILSMCMGSMRSRTWTFKSTAQAGNDIWVTGTLGDAAVGFFHHGENPLNKALQRPEPPVSLAYALHNFGLITAMTDVSDGLYVDLQHMCTTSKVGAIIEPDQLPESSFVYKKKDALAYKTMFGEDYELLFAATPSMEDLIKQTAAKYRIPVRKIGRFVSDDTVCKLSGMEWPKPLFSHF